MKHEIIVDKDDLSQYKVELIYYNMIPTTTPLWYSSTTKFHKPSDVTHVKHDVFCVDNIMVR